MDRRLRSSGRLVRISVFAVTGAATGMALSAPLECSGQDRSPVRSEKESQPGGCSADTRALSTSPQDELCDLDLSWSVLSEGDRYRVSVLPLTGGKKSLRINTMHNWTVRVQDLDGQPVEVASIEFDGGMPDHDHGFPTTPRVTRYLGNGTYLVEGVRFNMAGWWQFEISFREEDTRDRVVINLIVDH